ncbi:MAG: bifunctional folylpolyglutamate synthase/dihydrofolate synthase [Anaerolineae bacterium]|nr:bifunctional folylpolyglutamate synthase/dihydrofolate synthase [Anaerolineae bacterium]
MTRYHDALRYLYSLIDYEKRRVEVYSPRVFKLERVQSLLDKLGNPHRAYPTLHIAGTKGKGSVAAMLAACAQAGGLRTGLYISPHLHTYRERMQINRELITRDALTALVEEVKPVAAEVPGVTTFEVTTAIGFLYFARQQVDIVVAEVGLGGRLDATNVIIPEISIITSLSMEHTQLLGNTLADIAREKGGIIKAGVPVLSAPQSPEAVATLEAIAAERNAPFTLLSREWQWEAQSRTLNGQSLLVKCVGESPHLYENIAPAPLLSSSSASFAGKYDLSLLGDFQQENAALAIAACAILYESGHTWAHPDALHQALRTVVWPGRMEVLSRESPLLLLDGAHNAYSMHKLVEALNLWFPGIHWIVLYGASSDKDIEGMLRELQPLCERVIMTRSHHPRATMPQILVEKALAVGLAAEVAADSSQALTLALAECRTTLGILATGSLYLVADVREAWAGQTGKAIPLGDWVDEPWEVPV